MDEELTQEQKRALEDMIARRRKNTGESREDACRAIGATLQAIAAGKLVLDVVDDAGVVTGVRDAAGYHPNANDPSRRGTA